MNLLNTSSTVTSVEAIRRCLRTVPDFPQPGINFIDIAPLLANPRTFRGLVERIATAVKASGAEKIVALESRGFLIGIAVAQELDLPFIAARKGGKLPGEVIGVSYALEYGEQKLELQKDAVRPGDKVAVVDDVLATGGTARAASDLIERLGGTTTGYFFAIEICFLKGRSAIPASPVSSIVEY